MSSLVKLKAKNDSRLAEEKRLIDRKRNTLILMLNHCLENGYIDTAEKLQQEAGITLSKFEVADNIDLNTIVQEFESYYELKFGKKPKLVRRLQGEEEKSKSSSIKNAADRRSRRNGYTSNHMPQEARVENNVAMKTINSTVPSSNTTIKDISQKNIIRGDGDNQKEDKMDLGLVGQKPAVRSTRNPAPLQCKDPQSNGDVDENLEERLLKPLPSFGSDMELKNLAETITRDIFQNNPNVHWDDVVELNDAKRLLKEAVVMPIKYPELFSGLLSPWCGILLFGPPGTGKTMLAKAVATECRTTFFNISASTIVSKYRGDSEKLVRMLFELARYHAPSTIFLDEIDSIMGQRGGGGGQEHEASRRMKTELLIQMDGLAKSSDLVFVLAASNLPWELDMAMLRRLEKRVLVTLPGPAGRRMMIEQLLKPYVSESFNVDHVVDSTEGYSGADLKLVAKEAAMGPVRTLMSKLESIDPNNPACETPETENWRDLLESVCLADVENALLKTKPSAFKFASKYEKWQKDFGSR